MDLTRRLFLGLLTAPLVFPPAPELTAPPPAGAGDDHPAFSEFLETTLITQVDQTP